MMSALECYKHANHCQELAFDARDGACQTLLFSLVVQWRRLGDTAETHAARLRRSYATPSGETHVT